MDKFQKPTDHRCIYASSPIEFAEGARHLFCRESRRIEDSRGIAGDGSCVLVDQLPVFMATTERITYLLDLLIEIAAESPLCRHCEMLCTIADRWGLDIARPAIFFCDDFQSMTEAIGVLDLLIEEASKTEHREEVFYLKVIRRRWKSEYQSLLGAEISTRRE